MRATTNMAAPSKKRVTENVDMSEDDILGDENEDEMQSDESEEETPMNEEVQVEFEARRPEGSDFHGIKSLLQQLFLKANINLSEMTDTLLSQNYIGSIVKQSDIPEDDEGDSDDDDPVFGITSVINLTSRKELECVKQLKSMLMGKCQEVSPKQTDRLKSILDDEDKQVGFVINERFINIPPQLSLPMFKSLRKEMESACKKNMKYKFDWYLMISKAYKQKLTKKGRAVDTEILFTNQEEEFLKKHTSVMFDYSVSHERDGVVEGGWDADEDMEALRSVLVFTADKLDQFITELEAELQ
ncbi:protein BCCIP homolog [Liolophura sinensis]|uniref:protein BCCIP homolog n=1 Tax=Liolophura sinensis TaxID=3198878 RepID=UPI003158549D